MFYDEEKKAVVNQELSAEREALGRKLTKAETMKITRHRIDTFFENASEEIKEEVSARVDQVKAARKAPLPPADSRRVRSPEEYQKYVAHYFTELWH